MPKAPPIHRPFGKRKVARAPRKDDAGAKLTRSVHNSSRWRYQVQPAHLRQYPLCSLCESEGRIQTAVHVDHIKPLRDGGAPFDPMNLRSLCQSHHSAVTRRWQGQRGEDHAAPAPTYTIA